MKNQSCLICHSKSLFLLKKLEYKLYKCSNCSLVFVFPVPSPEEIKQIYSVQAQYQVNKTKDLKNVTETKSYKKILTFLTQFKRGKILDIGCSNGEFLYFAKKRGFKTYGIELNPITAAIARTNGIEAFNGTLEQAKIKAKSFDYIFLGDVIEHVSDPRKLMTQCYRILKKDGLIIISTPNLNCFWAYSTFQLYKIFNIPWSAVTPPFHLSQFSQNNLDLLASQLRFKKITQWFNSPPPLTYELWFTTLPSRYVKNRNFPNFLSYYFAYFLYAIFYILNKIVSKILNRDNSMTIVYQK